MLIRMSEVKDTIISDMFQATGPHRASQSRFYDELNFVLINKCTKVITPILERPNKLSQEIEQRLN